MRLWIGGFGVDDLALDDAVGRVAGLIEGGGPAEVVAVNAAKLARAGEDRALADQLGAADLVLADGIAVVVLARLLGVPLGGRVCGIDLFLALLGAAEARGWGVFFLGAREPVLERALQEVRRTWPRLRIAGWHHGFFDDPGAVAERVRRSGAELLFVGMGSPAQEAFLRRWREVLGVPVRMGIGGSLDVLAGEAPRAPGPLRRMGLEWAHRLGQAPRARFGRAIADPLRLVARLAVHRSLFPREPRASSRADGGSRSEKVETKGSSTVPDSAIVVAGTTSP